MDMYIYIYIGLFLSTAFYSFLCTIISHSSLDVFLGIMILLCILFFKCLLLVYKEAPGAQW